MISLDIWEIVGMLNQAKPHCWPHIHLVMDPWKDLIIPSHRGIYLGAWTNWSRGRILGATLTLTIPDGNLVVTFAAFFFTLVATGFWKIACICAHWYYSTAAPRDALYHQRQVILRNSYTPQSGLWRILQLAWGFRREYRRINRSVTESTQRLTNVLQHLWHLLLVSQWGLIILISFIIEPTLSYLHHKQKYKQYAYLEWVTNEVCSYNV